VPKYDFNAVVIGGGTAGLISANIMAQSKARVALVERHAMGGDCLNTGCVPSKALISSAKVAWLARNAEKFGVRVEGVSVDFPAVMDQVRGIIDYIAPIDSRERYTSLGCVCFESSATIVSPHEVMIGDQRVTTAHIVVASGASPMVPKIPGLDGLEYLHSDNLWSLRELPGRLLIVGSGPIGCELAQAFSRLGSQVTVISLDAVLLPREDPEVGRHMAEVFEAEKITLMLGSKISRFEQAGTGGRVVFERAEKAETLEFDRVLLAAGRVANTTGLGLEKLGVSLAKGGTIVVDRAMRTSVANIWACGDVSGPYQFTHMSAYQAGFVALNILASPFKTFKADYSQVPWVTYTDPEIAKVGINESEAKAQGIAYEATSISLSHLDRAVTERANHGFVKVLTVPKKGRILGVTIVGPHAGEMLAEFNIAVKNKLDLRAILNTIHPYPTFSEANRSVATAWRQKSIPVHLLGIAERYFRWRRS
jgi:pyruvate/2-oxoglutarate dehydrogenase complex dihydrolipoamide dehydrogenase (E3) component